MIIHDTVSLERRVPSRAGSQCAFAEHGSPQYLFSCFSLVRSKSQSLNNVYTAHALSALYITAALPITFELFLINVGEISVKPY